MNWSLFAILEITDKLYTILKVLEHLKTEREKCFKMFFSCQNKLNGHHIKKEKTTYQSKHLKKKK